MLAAAGMVARAQVSELGAAASYAGLELSSSNTFTISKVTTQINGNVGVAPNGALDFSGGGKISGQIDAGTGATLTITGSSTATGGIIRSDAQMSSVVADAASAATYYGGLRATRTLASIVGSQTIAGTGGLNVIDVTGGINLQSHAVLTLSGGASDQFVFDVSAASRATDLILGGGSSIVLDGISANQVVFNLIGSGLQMDSGGESSTRGVFLAENGSITISGGVHESNFISGGALTIQSGPTITGVTSAGLTPVPELSPALMGVAGLALLTGLALASRRLGFGVKLTAV